jgi:hypothetical protein
VHAAALGREAIVILSGLLEYGSTNELLVRKYITLPSGFTIEQISWFNVSTRSYWVSLDYVWGAGVANSSMAVLFKTQ